jgi:two-component system cell cycle sensor histidine kinase/response regulator CckA
MAAQPTYEQLQKRVKELERKLAKCVKNEKVLRDNHERFLQLYERAPLAYQSLDEQGRLIEVNQAWLDMLGYSREEVIGRSVAEFLSKEWKEHFKQNFPRFKSVGEVLGVEFELRTKEGIPILVSINGKIGQDREGNFQQTHCILYDITARDRADRMREEVIADLQKKLAAKSEDLKD